VKIAYVITRGDAVGGASIHVRDLAHAVRERGHDARVFLGGTGPVTEMLVSADVPFTVLRHLGRDINPVRDAQAWSELKHALAGWQPDLISAHTAKAGWLGRAAGRALGIPVIYTPHGLAVGDRLGRVQGHVFTLAERIAAPWAAAIVCVSEAEKQLALQKRISLPDRLTVIQNGVHDNGLRARPAAEPPRIVCVARLEPPKDHQTLFAALRSLLHLQWELVLVGDGPLEAELRASAGERVRFLGAVPDPSRVLAESQLFVLPSRSEGFPRSILEAMRAGLPVVASDVGGVREAVEAEVSGLVVPPVSPYALAEALKTLLTQPLKRERMGSAGHLRYQERFRFEAMLSRTLRLYATIVGDSNPAHLT
jgi:glycosyltransferase involved in cell wall biosynthesis